MAAAGSWGLTELGNIFVVAVVFILMMLMSMMMLLFYPRNLPLNVGSKSGQLINCCFVVLFIVHVVNVMVVVDHTNQPLKFC